MKYKKNFRKKKRYPKEKLAGLQVKVYNNNVDGALRKFKKMIKGEKCDFESSSLSKREWNELMESFGFKEKIL